MYMMKRERKSGFLGGGTSAWRQKVSAEYWESSNKAQNVTDVMVSILSGHKPNYKCAIPGNPSSTIPSRAETYLDGVWRINSRRQQADLVKKLVLRTVRDGSAGLRIYWQPTPRQAEVITMPNPDEPMGQPWVIQQHTADTFPICLEVIDIDKLYWRGPGVNGKPFSEIFYVQKRTAGDVMDEWETNPQVDASKIVKGIQLADVDTVEEEYVEWWGQTADGRVWYAIIFRDEFIIPPQPIQYPAIPFVLTMFKEGDGQDEPGMDRLPFLYPLFYALDKHEYVRSRTFRLIDMFANMNPYHSGESPINQLDATWGKVIELGPKEDIRFPSWPGQPPDVYKEIDSLQDEISEGSFSGSMFGQVSSRVSGYAMSQIIGADTLRTDMPRTNLELALCATAEIIFGLMVMYSPNVYLAVTSQVKNRRMASMLSGIETKSLVVEAFIKPKQTSDEIRLASLGAQLAAMPNPPVSNRYILEHYFGVNQPEEEMLRKLDEEAMNDPIVRMTALAEVLTESGNPYAQIIQAQLEAAVGGMFNQQQAGPGGAPQQMGRGMAQGIGGNEPQIPPSGDTGEEVGPTPQTMQFGGPKDYE
jgi:hypothetical protein